MKSKFMHGSFLVVSMLWLLVGCQKKDDPKPVTVSFDVIDSVPFTLDLSSSLSSAGYMPTGTVYSKCAQACEANNTSVDRLQSVALTSTEVTITAPIGQNLDALQRLTLYIMTAQGTNRSVLTTTDIIPRGATMLTLAPVARDLTDYLRPGTYYIIPYLEMNQPSQFLAQVGLRLIYRVQAQRL